MKLFLVVLLFAVYSVQAAEFKGRLEWVHKVELRALENGVVANVPVIVGDHVKRGEVLVSMDLRQLQATLSESNARGILAKLSSQDADRQLVRAEELFERGLIAEQELKDTELEQAAALVEQEAAKAAKISAAVALERAELRAPFDGVVVAINVWRGDVIYQTLQRLPLVEIASDDQMLARVLVTADIIHRYQQGQQAKVSVGGKSRDASIYSLGVKVVRVDTRGAEYELDVIFKTRPGETLRPSERALITFP